MSVVTFNNVKVDLNNVGEQFNIKLKNDQDEKIPLTFPPINQSCCSCDKCIQPTNLDNFKITEYCKDNSCAICRNKLSDNCIECLAKVPLDSNSECPVIKSLSCDHKFHYCCIKRWLKMKTICPLCANDWLFVDPKDKTVTTTDGISTGKIIVHYNDQIEEFNDKEDLLNQIGARFNLDMTKYKLTQNKVYVDEYKNGRYGLCTPDVHSGFNALKLFCKMGETISGTQFPLFIKYSTTIKELREEISKLFDIFRDQIKIVYNETEITSDYDHLNIYNMNIVGESTIIVESIISSEFVMEIVEDFMVLYPNCGITSNNIQNIIAGKISWIPYPFVKDTAKQELYNMLSSLYILVKKVNMNNDTVAFVTNKFEKYMILYDFNKTQIQLAKKSLESLLKLTNFGDRDRMILSNSFHELIFKIQQENHVPEIKMPLLSTNILCNLLLSLNPAERVNWKYAIKDVQIDKTFNIYSPLVLVNGTPPLLTLNENANVVVFVGKGKDLSLPIILYNPLTNSEFDVNAAELGKKISNNGETLMVDDRIYEEGIMVCIDTSNSMQSCSNFDEDLIAKQKDEEEAQLQFYKILSIEKAIEIEPADIRKLQNTVIWFITHPNFNDWNKNKLNNIICCEQSDNLEMAQMMSKYSHLFNKLLNNKTVTIGGNHYSHSTRIRKDAQTQEANYKSEPLTEYLCPISHDVMVDPVIARDGFTYEKTEIVEWFKRNSTSPLTNKTISKKLLENKTLKVIIDEWKHANIILSTETNESNIVIIKHSNSESKGFNSDSEAEPQDIVYKYTDTTNIWDLIYKIYCVEGYTHTEYTLRINMQSFDRTTLIKNVRRSKMDPFKIELYMRGGEMIAINIHKGFSPFSTRLMMPMSCQVKNIIYKYGNYSYDTCEVWKDLKDTGDSISSGQLLLPSTGLWNDTTISIFDNEKIRTNSRHYMTRLGIVKKLFDAFINRSIAYSFNTAIGLMSFSDKSKLECDITPFYESFRDKMDSLDTNGATALYESLKDAIHKLVMWREADLDKRKNAKLRVICLSDGKDTGLTNIKLQVETLFIKHNIILDCIVIGDDYDTYIGEISKKTGGYMFNPSTIKYAFDIMELETMILSKNRAPLVTYRGIISETTTPPIINPTSALKAKSTTIANSVNRNEINVMGKILQKELVEIMKNPHPFIDVYVNDDDICFWKVVFKGPDGTPYSKGTWLAYIQFPQSYPSVAPNIRFVTPIKHCNINNYGRVCHSILDRNYTPAVKMSLILQCIYGLLLNPDVTDPLDTNLAMMYYGSYKSYIRCNTGIGLWKLYIC